MLFIGGTIMDLGRGRKRKVYDRNRPSQLIDRSGHGNFGGSIASDVQ